MTNEEAALSTEPDFSFVSWATFQAGRVRLQHRVVDDTDYIELVGSLDLVVEIVSDSSVRKDTKLLRDAYLRAGVLEYWRIDARRGEVRFEILTCADGEWRASGDPSGAQDSRVFGARWTWTQVINRAGRFTYTLARTA